MSTESCSGSCYSEFEEGRACSRHGRAAPTGAGPSARVKDIFVIFECPRGKGFGPLHVCQAQIIGPDAPWRNIGTAEKPTLHQSYHCKGGCGWHGYIVDGKLLDNPTVKDAAASVTTLLECSNCHHPELLSVGISPDRPARFEVKFQKTEVRPPIADPDRALLDSVFTMPTPGGEQKLTGRAMLTSLYQQEWLAETRPAATNPITSDTTDSNAGGVSL